MALLLLGVLAPGSISATDDGASPAAVSAQPSHPARGSDPLPLDRAFRFDADGLVPLADDVPLPVPSGTVTARWYSFRGWAVVVFEGLDAASAAQLCVGVSAVDPATGLLGHVTYDTASGTACDDAGAGPVPRASGATGVRTCAEDVAFISTIPEENGGPLFATLLAFPGDGTGIGVTGRWEPPGPLPEIDASRVDCGPLPEARRPVPPTPVPVPTPAITPAPPSSGTVPAADRAPAPSVQPAADCPAAEGGGLQVSLSRARRPLPDGPPGPSGSVRLHHRLPARRRWQLRGRAAHLGDRLLRGGRLRVLPCRHPVRGRRRPDRPAGADLRAILDEVLGCFGGDPMRVHLGGTSNGGLMAFALMAKEPQRFATLAGTPGAFPVQDPATVDPRIWAQVLAGRAVFNGVGSFDAEWRAEVIATHNALAAAGIESVFVEFPGQGHIPGPGFDSRPLRAFWAVPLTGGG